MPSIGALDASTVQPDLVICNAFLTVRRRPRDGRFSVFILGCAQPPCARSSQGAEQPLSHSVWHGGVKRASAWILLSTPGVTHTHTGADVPAPGPRPSSRCTGRRACPPDCVSGPGGGGIRDERDSVRLDVTRTTTTEGLAFAPAAQRQCCRCTIAGAKRRKIRRAAACLLACTESTHSLTRPPPPTNQPCLSSSCASTPPGRPSPP